MCCARARRVAEEGRLDRAIALGSRHPPVQFAGAATRRGGSSQWAQARISGDFIPVARNDSFVSRFSVALIFFTGGEEHPPGSQKIVVGFAG